MDDSYAKQKFYEAVASLIGTGSIQKRLRFALQPLSMLRASSGTVQHLPPDLELRLQKLMDRLTAKPPGNEEIYPPLDVTDEEGNELAGEIFSIFVGVMGGL